MERFTDDEMQRIAAALAVRAPQPCPRCGHASFQMLGGWTQLAVRVGADGQVTTIPCVAVACRHCGYVAQHTAGGLGL